MPPFCDHCREHLASVFVTQITDDDTVKFRLCEECARQKANDSELFSEIVAQIEDDSELMAIIDLTSENDEFPETFDDQEIGPMEALSFADDPFESEEAASQSGTIDPFDDELFPVAAYEIASRCTVCGTTWERIKGDGRCGCASCYSTFREQLLGVLARVHRGVTHTGKTPTTAHKKRLRLENLRKRRENQLMLLQTRLQNAVDAENYEEAAQIHDKIKSVTRDDE